MITAIGNAGGRILSGWVSDTFGRLHDAEDDGAAVGDRDAGARSCWRAAGGRRSSCSIALVYWCYGTQLSVFASTTADFYGTRNLGLNYGVLFTAWGAAGTLGPIIAGRVYDAFGDSGMPSSPRRRLRWWPWRR